MSITIMEVLENALYNLKHHQPELATEQLGNAILLLQHKEDSGLYDKFDMEEVEKIKEEK